MLNQQLLHIKLLLKRLGIVLLLFTLCRILFYIFNYHLFPTVHLGGFFRIMLVGLRYDMIAIILINSIFILMHIIPNPFRETKPYQLLLKSLFYSVNGIAVLLEASDFIYFEFAQQRTSTHIMGLANDIFRLIPQFIKDFWYLLVLCLVIFVAVEWLYRKTRLRYRSIRINYPIQTGFAIAIIFLCGFMIRGGITKPLNPESATEYVDIDEVSLATNTTYTILYTATHRRLNEKQYFSREKCDDVFCIIHENHNSALHLTRPREQKPNIVIILMESFSKEYSAFLNGHSEGYMPYLDSLMMESLVFTNAFANGKHSIDAIPSVCLSLPALMNDAIISSEYRNNSYLGLGHLMKSMGYQTQLFHGADAHSMSMDEFYGKAGFDEHFSMEDYGDMIDFDGNWGIYDEPFLQFTAKKLDETNKPFCSLIFTLSSHHPFSMPPKYLKTFGQGSHPILPSIRYADMALRRFFQTAKEMDWYDNTIFIITADHTGPVINKEYKTRLGHYAIPMIIHIPNSGLKGKMDFVVQQADILPTVLDYSGFEGRYLSFGSSLLDTTGFKFSINYMNGIYQFIHGEYVLYFDGVKTLGFYNYKEDRMISRNLAGKGIREEMVMEEKVRAIVQQYRYILVNDKMIPG